MKHTITPYLLLLLTLLPLSATAQDFDELWATGTAVGEGSLPLTRRPDGKFRFAGALKNGELKVMTTETFQKGITRFLKPVLVDSYLINKGLTYQLTTDETQAGWVVSFDEETYRFLIDPDQKTLNGELALPWNELLLAGSAHDGGANSVEWSRDAMVAFDRDRDDPYVFTWTGVLAIYDDVVEPGRLKLEGQSTWGPRELHPFTQDEDLLESRQLRSGGDDTKWRVRRPGAYRIVVDLFRETFHAELLAQYRGGDATAIETVQSSEFIVHSSQSAMSALQATSKVYDLQGRCLDGSNVTPNTYRGLHIVRMADGSVRKVINK